MAANNLRMCAVLLELIRVVRKSWNCHSDLDKMCKFLSFCKICWGTSRRIRLLSDSWCVLTISHMLSSSLTSPVLFFKKWFASSSVFYRIAKRLFLCSLTQLALLWQSWPTFSNVYSYCFGLSAAGTWLYTFFSPEKQQRNGQPNGSQIWEDTNCYSQV